MPNDTPDKAPSPAKCLQLTREAVERSRMVLEQDTEFITLQSARWRCAYRSLLADEFTPDQAMTILLHRGPMLI